MYIFALHETLYSYTILPKKNGSYILNTEYIQRGKNGNYDNEQLNQERSSQDKKYYESQEVIFVFGTHFKI